ncbi:MAG: phosphotransferase [Candidatus Obscuribacterales bacterium]|nr:phosphotransferase [Candidatus Obscuribacterales bacterium]
MDGVKTANSNMAFPWPSPQDYNEALQNPSHSFAEASLAEGFAEVDSLGLPKPNTGMFASVYRLHCKDADWAVRCFLRYAADQGERYAAIQAALKEANLPATLGFELQEQGLRVKGKSYPLLKMQWCDGENLDRWLYSKLFNRPALEAFLKDWKLVLRSLKTAGIAHGDLQHGNVLVQDGQIKLVDYDGMYVPSLAGRLSNELGHRSYQHPARTEEIFGAALDNFSAWVIYISAEILLHDPSLWRQLKAGDDCLLFRKRDLEDPLHSQAFWILEKHSNPEIRAGAKTIRSFLLINPEEVPSLDERPRSLGRLPDLIEKIEINEADSEESDSAEGLEAASSELAELSSSGSLSTAPFPSIFSSRKRTRSRVKGGFRDKRVRRSSINLGESEPEPPEPQAFHLSPLAELARRVRRLPLPDSAAAGEYQIKSLKRFVEEPQIAPPEALAEDMQAPRLLNLPLQIRNRILRFLALFTISSFLAYLCASGIWNFSQPKEPNSGSQDRTRH